VKVKLLITLARLPAATPLASTVEPSGAIKSRLKEPEPSPANASVAVCPAVAVNE